MYFLILHYNFEANIKHAISLLTVRRLRDATTRRRLEENEQRIALEHATAASGRTASRKRRTVGDETSRVITGRSGRTGRALDDAGRERVAL